MKHIHYDTIVAWANGEEVQVFSKVERKWKALPGNITPFWYTDSQYRVKPKEVKYTPHWPAVIDHPLRLSQRLFKTEEEAVRVYRHTIRLATEYPPVLLPEGEPIYERR